MKNNNVKMKSNDIFIFHEGGTFPLRVKLTARKQTSFDFFTTARAFMKHNQGSSYWSPVKLRYSNLVNLQLQVKVIFAL